MSITTVRSSVFALVLAVSVFVLLPSFAHADTELFTNNPGFETGTGSGTVPPATATGWTTPNISGTITASASIATGANAHNGVGRAGTLSVTAVTGIAEAKWLTPAIVVSQGQVLTVSEWYKSTALSSVFIYPNGASPVTWVGDAATSSASFTQFHGQTYIVPAGVTSIQIGHTLGRLGTLTTDDYSVQAAAAVTQFSQGVVTLTFDDGWQSFWDVASSSLTAHNLKATNYIITGPDGSNLGTNTPNQDYMSQSEIQKLFTLGFDIQDHTKSHLDLAKEALTGTGYSYATRDAMWADQIVNSTNALKTLLGASAPMDNFAYPYGSYCAPTLTDCQSATVQNAGAVNVMTAIKNAGFKAARSVDQGYNIPSDLTNDNQFKLKMQHVTDQTTAADIEGWINFARDNKVWLIVMFHNTRPAATTTPAYTKGADSPACIEPKLDASGNEIPGQFERDPDCTTGEVVKAVSDYLATQPTVSVRTMHDVITNLVPPVIAAHADVTAEATSTSVVVNYTAPLVSPSNAAATCTPASGTVFNLTPATTTVTCSFTGAANTTFNVIVKAHTTPVATSVATTTIVAIATPVTLKATGTGTLTYTTTSSPKFGTLSGTGANLIYTPQASTTAFTDSFTFKVNDGLVDSNVATATISVTLAPDTAAPQITSISSNDPGQNDATITWTTDENSNSTVVYGTDSNYGATTTDAAMTTSHSVALPSLATHTTYHFMVISTDASNNTATSSDQTFTTDDVQQSGGGGCSGCGCGGCGGGGGGGGGGGVVVGLIGQVNGGQVLGTSTQALTDAQIAAILDLLKSFGADQSVIDNVSNALHGKITGNTSGKYVFTKTLVLGSKNDDVTALQNLLTAMGIYSGPVTGTFGPLTSAATKTYQIKHGIAPTGTVGPLTRASLNQ